MDLTQLVRVDGYDEMALIPKSTKDASLPPLAANLRWESERRGWLLKDLIDAVTAILSENAEAMRGGVDNIGVTVKRHWNGDTKSPQPLYLAAYQKVFGYPDAETISSPTHRESRVATAAFKDIPQRDVATASFAAAAAARSTTVDQSLELAKELLEDPSWSPYIAMALQFIKISR